jgi:glutamine amidotransferase
MIAIVDYGSGNIASVQYALQRLGVPSQLTADANIIKSASHVILPGVGAAGAAMQILQKKYLINTIRELFQPVLGICLGKQLFYQSSEEDNVDCLQILPGTVKKLNPQPTLAVPHMGWNTVTFTKSGKLFKDIEENNYVYYVHSYAAAISELSCAVSAYNQDFSAAIEYKNFFGVQFHPEKSGKVGEKILENFLEIQC